MIHSLTASPGRLQPWEFRPFRGVKKIFAYLIGLLCGLIAIIAGGAAFILPMIAVYGDIPLNTPLNILIFIGQELGCLLLALIGGKIVLGLNRKTEYDNFYRQGDAVAVIAGAWSRRFFGKASIRYADRTIYITAFVGRAFAGNIISQFGPPLLSYLLTGGRIIYAKTDRAEPQEVPVEADNIEWVKGDGPRLTIKLFQAPVAGLNRMTLFLPAHVAVSTLQDFEKHVPGKLPASYRQALAKIAGASGTHTD